MASRGKGARVKGAAFERLIARTLTAVTPYEWKRGIAQTRDGTIPDVYSDDVPGFHFELKRMVRCNIKAALRQALTDIGDKEQVPVVITKEDRGETLVTMRLDDWLPMFVLYLERE